MENPFLQHLPRYLQEVVEMTDPEDKNTLHFLPNRIISEPIFLRHNLTISGSSLPNSIMSFGSLQISGNVVLNNTHLKCKIQVSNGSLTCNDCTIEPFGTNEISIELFSRSTATFNNCHFISDQISKSRTSLVVRDRSKAFLNHCEFSGSSVNVICLDSSRINCSFTHFSGGSRFAVYLYRFATGLFEDCSITKTAGKGLFALENCHATLKRCLFSENKTGGIMVVQSKLQVLECTFTQIPHMAISSQKKSKVSIQRSLFSLLDFNGVLFDNSKGYVTECHFSEIKNPAIAVFGIKSNPVIVNNTIEKSLSAVVIRDASAPLVQNLSVSEMSSAAILISDFSRPLIENCFIEKCPVAFSVSNAAIAQIYNQNIDPSVKVFCEAFTYGEAYYLNQKISETTLIKSERLHGKVLELNDSPESRHFNSFSLHVTFKLPDQEEHCAHCVHISPQMTLVADEPLFEDPVLPKPLACLSFKHTRFSKKVEDESEHFCMKCGETTHNKCTHCVEPCGHMVLCEECAKTAQECPLCHLKALSTPQVYKEDICVICLENNADTICSCGHQCVCYECAAKIWQGKKTCPLCQGSLLSIKHNFY